MPGKGLFTQCAIVLTERAPDGTAVESAITSGGFDLRKQSAAEGEPNWISGYPSWSIAMRSEVNGVVVVEAVNDPWPDDMGDPKDPTRAMLFGAWSMGFLGPLTWPGSLARAKQFASAFGSKDVADAAGRHRGFIRILSTYAAGADDNAKVIPEDYDASAELEFVTSVARAICKVAGALCYFNPAGETLFTSERLEEEIHSLREMNLPPLSVWAAGRLMRIEDAPPWMMGDVYGMGQLEAQDHEAAFRRDRHDAGEVMSFLRNISIYTLKNGPVIKDGHTSDGPGGRWRATAMEESAMPAPRPVLRWFPEDGSEPPAKLRLRRPPAATPPATEPKGMFGRLKSMFKR